MKPVRALLAAVLAVALPALAAAQANYGPGNPPPSRPLDDAEMGRYVKALEGLAGAGLGSDPSEVRDAAVAVAYTEQAKQVLESNGFTPESFSSVHWNAMTAWIALELEGHRAELEQARAQQGAALEAMRAQLTPEQFAQMEQAMEGARVMMEAAEDVPPANLELVKRYRPQLERALTP